MSCFLSDVKWDTVNLSDFLSFVITAIGVVFAAFQYKSYLKEKKDNIIKEQTSFVINETKAALDPIKKMNIGSYVNFNNNTLEYDYFVNFKNTLEHILSVKKLTNLYTKVDLELIVNYLKINLPQSTIDMFTEFDKVEFLGKKQSDEIDRMHEKTGNRIKINYIESKKFLEIPFTTNTDDDIISDSLTKLLVQIQNPLIGLNWVF